MAQVVIMMGSKSDEEKVSPCVDVLRSLGISYLFTVSSAHRTPERTEKILREQEAAGAKVFICAAGMAAHLAGAVAARTTRPVIGIPVSGGLMGGMDAMLATVQMPPGFPVATVAMDKAGARNAAWLAAQISSPAALAEAVRLRLDARPSRPAEDPAAALRRRLDQLEGQRARYLDLYAGDLLSMEELRRRLRLLAERGARLREDLERLTRDPPRDLEAEITEQVRRVLSLEDITNGELRQLIDRITVSEKGDVSIYPARPAEEPPAAPGAFVGNG